MFFEESMTKKPERQGRVFDIGLDAGEHFDLLVRAAINTLMVLSAGDGVYKKTHTGTGAVLLTTVSKRWSLAITREMQGVCLLVVAACVGDKPKVVVHEVQKRMTALKETEVAPSLDDLAALCAEVIG